jgi:hypothetical protein
MSWLHFFLWIACIYAIYYLFIIFTDFLRTDNKPDAQGWVNELTFSEIESPQRIVMEDQSISLSITEPKAGNSQGGSAIIASGGVLISELLSLARKESIVYTGQVSY